MSPTRGANDGRGAEQPGGGQVEIEVDRGTLPRRLTACRLRRGLTVAELARRAGVSDRTVLDLERGRRDRTRVRTLLLLADALGVPPEELLGDRAGAAAGAIDGIAGTAGRSRAGRRGRSRRAARLAGLAVLILLALAGMALSLHARAQRRDLELREGDLTARDGLLGRQVWRLDAEARVRFWRESPWSPDLILAGLDATAPDGGRLLLLRRKTGEVLWARRPDTERAIRCFPDVMAAMPHALTARDAVACDLRGDGEPVLVAHFSHAKYYPTWLVFLDREGRELGTYLHRGYFYEPLLPVDLDGDGCEELLAAGTNNSPALQAATVVILDRDCHTGVSLDTASGDTICLPDSARLRLVLPAFEQPWTGLLQGRRLCARRLELLPAPDGGPPRIRFRVVLRAAVCTVTLDSDLRPLTVEPSGWLSGFATQWPAPYAGGGPADPAWLREWLERSLRFEAGHYPPGPCRRPPAVAGDIADGGGGP